MHASPERTPDSPPSPARPHGGSRARYSYVCLASGLGSLEQADELLHTGCVRDSVVCHEREHLTAILAGTRRWGQASCYHIAPDLNGVAKHTRPCRGYKSCRLVVKVHVSADGVSLHWNSEPHDHRRVAILARACRHAHPFADFLCTRSLCLKSRDPDLEQFLLERVNKVPLRRILGDLTKSGNFPQYANKNSDKKFYSKIQRLCARLTAVGHCPGHAQTTIG
jgi:hypothetical protein